MQIEIDGAAYEFPSVGSFDLDEDRIFYKGTGLHAEDVWLGFQDGGELSFTELITNEGFIAAMAHIAYRREHPDQTAEQIFRVVGRQKRIEMIASLANSVVSDETEADAVPLEDATKSQNESGSISNGENGNTTPNKDGSFGKPSALSSVPPADGHATTGTGASDTSSMSARKELVG